MKSRKHNNKVVAADMLQLFKTLLILLILEQFCSPIKAASVGEVIKRTLHRQEPQTPIPSFLSENGRALPRKIQTNSDSSKGQ